MSEYELRAENETLRWRIQYLEAVLIEAGLNLPPDNRARQNVKRALERVVS